MSARIGPPSNEHFFLNNNGVLKILNTQYVYYFLLAEDKKRNVCIYCYLKALSHPIQVKPGSSLCIQYTRDCNMFYIIYILNIISDNNNVHLYSE